MQGHVPGGAGERSTEHRLLGTLGNKQGTGYAHKRKDKVRNEQG